MTRGALTGVLLAFFLGSGCAGTRYGGPDRTPGFTVPTPIAEGKRGDDEPAITSSARHAPKATAKSETPPEPPPALPDPEALRQREQWQYDILYEGGQLRVLAVKARTFPKPIVSARRMGRFAIELWIGRELIERVRFDFPLLAAEDKPKAGAKHAGEMPNFAAATRVSQSVLVPASRRATRALLIDRATGKTEALPWPPDAPFVAPAAVTGS